MRDSVNGPRASGPKKRAPSVGKAIATVVIAFAVAGCCYLRTPYLLKQLNAGSTAPSIVARPSIQTRIAKVVRTHMADNYFDPRVVGEWLATAGSAPDPLVRHLRCLQEQRSNPTHCYRELELTEAPRDALGETWKLPPPPVIERDERHDMPPLTDPTSRREVDLQRFMANASWIAPSLVALLDVYGAPLSNAELSAGIRAGMEDTRNYVLSRKWHRDPSRPSVAIVLSGGAANGAFTAGFVWRLMEILDRCHNSRAGDQCPQAKVDLVVGTSTGSLIGVLVDLFHVPGQEARARQLLVDNYTCVTERELYCVHNKYDSALATDLRGLVRFDGIKQKLTEAMVPGMSSNHTELVAMSVDFESGDIYALSDQDPADATDPTGRIDAVLASIVEPVMAEPVDGLARKPGEPKRVGTFVDGGVRSGVPVLEAVRRGAERTLVISTSSLDPSPGQRPQSALEILMRTIDLATSQGFSAEAHTAELEAAARRLVEFDTCKYRLGILGFPKERIHTYCKRLDLYATTNMENTPEGASGSFIGPRLFEEVALSWRSEWVYRPENGGPAAVGYSFDPELMRALFAVGVRTFQKRCDETLRMFGIGSALRSLPEFCGMSAEAAVAHATDSFKPLARCKPNDREVEVCR